MDLSCEAERNSSSAGDFGRFDCVGDFFIGSAMVGKPLGFGGSGLGGVQPVYDFFQRDDSIGNAFHLSDVLGIGANGPK
jgi:hypothetical protein